MIASHYAEPFARSLAKAALMRAAPAVDSEVVFELGAGDRFEMLDDSLGWAWGYGGPERRVGYVQSEALGPPP